MRPLKSKTILDRKPDLIPYPNHYQDEQRPHRYYNSRIHGQAVSGGQGWLRSAKLK
jgi:hypothetical protein